MNPNNPFFKPRFITALNLRMKKLIPATEDMNETAMENKVQAIAFTVLKDMGIKGWLVKIAMRPSKGGKFEMGCRFIKEKNKDGEKRSWTP